MKRRTLAGAAALVLLAGCSGAPQPGGAGLASCGGSGSVSGFTAEQVANARAIAGVAVGLGLGQAGALIGIDVAITESTLVNVNFGDVQNGLMTTSRGLFQQIAAWAPEADRLDPVKSATMFFKGGQGGQAGLMSVVGWQRMPVPQAAQAVQGSEFSSGSNYAAVLPQAAQIANAIVPGCSSGSASVGSSVVGAKIVAAVQSQIGTPYVWGGGGPGGPSGRDYVDGRGPGFDCSGLTQWAVYTATGGRVTIPRTAADQRSAGAAVAADFAAMLPGDLIVFGTGHVGVYIGNEQMINAPESTKNVRVDSVGSGSFNGNQATWTVRRIS